MSESLDKAIKDLEEVLGKDEPYHVPEEHMRLSPFVLMDNEHMEINIYLDLGTNEIYETRDINSGLTPPSFINTRIRIGFKRPNSYNLDTWYTFRSKEMYYVELKLQEKLYDT